MSSAARLMRVAILLVVVSLPAFAQGLPDPGRRVPENEPQLNLDLPKRDATEEARSHAVKPPPPRAVDPRVCESARVNWQNACGTPYSYRSRGPACNEAYAIYRDSCG